MLVLYRELPSVSFFHHHRNRLAPPMFQRGDPLAGDGESRSREVDGLAPFFPIEHPQKPAAVPLTKVRRVTVFPVYPATHSGRPPIKSGGPVPVSSRFPIEAFGNDNF
jgi:hypothetical protein